MLIILHSAVFCIRFQEGSRSPELVPENSDEQVVYKQTVTRSRQGRSTLSH